MAAIQRIEFEEYGGPEVLKLVERPETSPGAGEVRVRNLAIGVNFIDTYHRSGLYPLPSLPSGLGLEGAGTIEARGEGVRVVGEGDRVVYCSGPLGAYSTSHTVKAERVLRIPSFLDELDAVAVFLKGLTVQYLIRQVYPVTRGETVLFHAAAGGVGLIAMQWLRSLGARVIGTVGTNEKAKLAQSLGCTHTVLYEEEDVVARVRELTDGKGVPVVFDSVGAATFERSLDCLAPKGLLVSFGNSSGAIPPLDLSKLAAKGSLMVTRPTLANFTGTRESINAAANELFGEIKNGTIRVRRSDPLALADARRAHKLLESRSTTGSTVLVP